MSADEFCFSFEDLNRQLYSKHTKNNKSADENQKVSDELDFCFCKYWLADRTSYVDKNFTHTTPPKPSLSVVWHRVWYNFRNIHLICRLWKSLDNANITISFTIEIKWIKEYILYDRKLLLHILRVRCPAFPRRFQMPLPWKWNQVIAKEDSTPGQTCQATLCIPRSSRDPEAVQEKYCWRKENWSPSCQNCTCRCLDWALWGKACYTWGRSSCEKEWIHVGGE